MGKTESKIIFLMHNSARRETIQANLSTKFSVKNLFKVPFLEVIFLETSYFLQLFWTLQTHNLDDSFQIVLQILHLPMEIDIW